MNVNTIDAGLLDRRIRQYLIRLSGGIAQSAPRSRPVDRKTPRRRALEIPPLSQTLPTMVSSVRERRPWLNSGLAFGCALRRLRQRWPLSLALLSAPAALYAEPLPEDRSDSGRPSPYVQALAVYCRDSGCGPTPEGAERRLHEHPSGMSDRLSSLNAPKAFVTAPRRGREANNSFGPLVAESDRR